MQWSIRGPFFVLVNTSLWKEPVAEETDKQDAWLECRRCARCVGKGGKQIFASGHYLLFTPHIIKWEMGDLAPRV